jgi:hypothetical protein
MSNKALQCRVIYLIASKFLGRSASETPFDIPSKDLKVLYMHLNAYNL